MSWTDYVGAYQSGIESHDRDVEEFWSAHESWLDDEEAKLRAALIAILLLWPFGDRDRLDSSRANQADIRRKRLRAWDRINRFEKRAIARFVGTGDVGIADGDRGLGRTRRDAVRRAGAAWKQGHILSAFDDAISLIGRGEGIEGDDLGGPSPSPGSPPRDAGGGSPIFLGPGDAPLDVFGRDTASLPELIEDGVTNPIGNIRNGTRQMRESLLTLSRGNPTRTDIVEHVNGSTFRSATKGTPQRRGGIALNRNNLRLSVQTHARAAFRDAIIRRALSRGINSFILLGPGRRLRGVSPKGAIAAHAYRIRSSDEWRDVTAALNRGRRSTSVWGLSGMHHGDFTVPVPVPPIYAADARAWARARRDSLAQILRRAA